MTVKEILEFFGIDPNVAGVKRLPLTELGTKLLTQDTVYSIDGEYTLHGLTVMITQTRLMSFDTMKTIVSELRITSGHKGTQILTPDNIFNVLSTHLTQL